MVGLAVARVWKSLGYNQHKVILGLIALALLLLGGLNAEWGAPGPLHEKVWATVEAAAATVAAFSILVLGVAVLLPSELHDQMRQQIALLEGQLRRQEVDRLTVQRLQILYKRGIGLLTSRKLRMNREAFIESALAWRGRVADALPQERFAFESISPDELFERAQIMEARRQLESQLQKLRLITIRLEDQLEGRGATRPEQLTP